MQDMTRLTELTEANNTIALLSERLNKANRLLSRYMIEFEASVDSQTLDIQVTAKRPFGAGGIIKTIQKDISQYYKHDVSSLAESICEEVFTVLLKDEMKKDLLQDLTRAVVNVALVESKR